MVRMSFPFRLVWRAAEAYYKAKPYFVPVVIVALLIILALTGCTIRETYIKEVLIERTVIIQNENSRRNINRIESQTFLDLYAICPQEGNRPRTSSDD